MITKEWFKAAGIRAIKTFAQTLAGMITVGAAFDDIVWLRVLEVGVVAALLSLLTSIKGLPEVGSDGQLVVNTTSLTTDVYKLELNDSLESLAEKSVVKLKVTN